MDTDGSLTINSLEFDKFLKVLNPAPKEVDVSGYNPSSYVREYLPLPYRSWSPYWDSPYYYSSYSPYYSRWSSSIYDSPYWRSSYYYDRYRYSSYYGGYSSYLDARYGSYVRPARYSYEPLYTSPVRTEVVYSSPVREKVVYTSSYSPVSTAYTYSSPVRTVYSSPAYDRTYVSPYSGSVIYY